ncbi:hypothetical protein [Streptomyces sp. B1I3]|uniref:hypothetical protein n=1 Tax=Streptomyces sp. B1I3 TaxID=3042264 RepID=UPI00278B1332|nr:hypothetical protein [Streptomyces sp. B1I3]MDQ0792916.1 hypothetical protein [Streptomyces sp. B1I3]
MGPLAHDGPGPALRETLRVLARGAVRAFTAREAAVVLRRGAWEAEEELEQLVDRQLLEPPAEAGDGYAFLPLTRLHAREP